MPAPITYRLFECTYNPENQQANPQNCDICEEPVERGQKVLGHATHIFHKACLEPRLFQQFKCPSCKIQLEDFDGSTPRRWTAAPNPHNNTVERVATAVQGIELNQNANRQEFDGVTEAQRNLANLLGAASLAGLGITGLGIAGLRLLSQLPNLTRLDLSNLDTNVAATTQSNQNANEQEFEATLEDQSLLSNPTTPSHIVLSGLANLIHLDLQEYSAITGAAATTQSDRLDESKQNEDEERYT